MSEDTGAYTDYTISAQQRLIHIVEALAREPLAGVTVKCLAVRLNLTRDTVYRALKNLEAAGWVRQLPTSAWALDAGLCLISERLRRALADVHKIFLEGERPHDP